jgi:hypothetical protein
MVSDHHKKRPRCRFRVSTARLSMAHGVHRQAESIRKAALAKVKPVSGPAHVDGFGQRYLVAFPLTFHEGAGLRCALRHLFK